MGVLRKILDAIPGAGWRKAGPLIPIALAGLVTLAAWFSDAQRHNNDTNEAGKTASQQVAAQPQPTLADKACAQAKAAPTYDSKKYDEWELCAQFLSAESTARSTEIAVQQLVLSVGGFLVVFGTLVVTGIQARAAVRGNQTALLVGQNQTRAYISFGLPRAPVDGERAFIFPILNTGATPARAIRWEFRLSFYDNLGNQKATLSTNANANPTSSDLPSDGKPHEVSITDHEMGQMRALLGVHNPVKASTFHIVLRYRDVFGRCFEINEKMEIGTRAIAEIPPDTLKVYHVRSHESEIGKDDYDKPIQLTPPK